LQYDQLDLVFAVRIDGVYRLASELKGGLRAVILEISAINNITPIRLRGAEEVSAGETYVNRALL
jgi:hypothetical protein